MSEQGFDPCELAGGPCPPISLWSQPPIEFLHVAATTTTTTNAAAAAASLAAMAKESDIALRAVIVTLKSPLSGSKSSKEVSRLTGLSTRQIDRIYRRACDLGFNPTTEPIIIKNEHLEDLPRSGRPSKQTPDNKDLLIKKIRLDRYGREKASAVLAAELTAEGIAISAATVRRILKSANFRKTKPTRKPGLTKKMREDRLRWCLEHQNWTLEDWKKVIWSDETSVVLLHRRGGYRIWRQPEEACVRSCIRERWKGSSEFMFWGCFTYDEKGPCHCWAPETAKDRQLAEARVEELNKVLEPAAKEAWELNTQMTRLGLRQRPGRQPTWRWNKKNGKLTRSGKGIDWYAY